MDFLLVHLMLSFLVLLSSFVITNRYKVEGIPIVMNAFEISDTKAVQSHYLFKLIIYFLNLFTLKYGLQFVYVISGA